MNPTQLKGIVSTKHCLLGQVMMSLDWHQALVFAPESCVRLNGWSA
jgi:hypothetical protein